MNAQVHTIQTRYAGCHFRSRLEARWAVFFDTLGIDWQYEPEGFELGELGRYLPDFLLTGPRLDREFWFEVKGQHPTDNEERRVDVLAGLTGRSGLIAYGDIPRVREEEQGCAYILDSMLFYGADGFKDWDFRWCVCPQCGLIGAEWCGLSNRLDCKCRAAGFIAHEFGDDSGEITINHPRLVAAYTAARSARFGR